MLDIIPNHNTLVDFGNQLSGTLILPDEPEYQNARSVWNGMIDKHPAFIVRCRGIADVIASINFARHHDLAISIKGGGHNISGLAVCDDGMMIDMSLMRGVWVDPTNQIARAQAGCLLGDVDRETQIHGLAAILGFVSKTGIAGLTLGGGFGYLTRKYGWTTDNVLSMELITAEGKLIRASDKENKDLFWGLRGGGGNFGVVTSIDYRLYPVGPQIMAGGIAWKLENAEEIFKMYHELVENAPHELTCALVIRIAPPAPWLSKSIHGKPVIALFVCYSGPLEEGIKQVAPIKNFGSPVGDIIQPRSYTSQQSILDATQPNGRRYYWKSEYMSQLNPEIFEIIMKHAGDLRSPHSAIILFPIGDALNELPMEHSAVGNRDAKWVLNITASWETKEDDVLNTEWARHVWKDMKKFSTGGTYLNFLNEEDTDDRIRAALGSNYDRLVQIKTKWDPENIFRINKNIQPVSN